MARDPAGTEKSLSIVPLSGALGAMVTGIDLRILPDEETMTVLKEAFLQHVVLVYPGQENLTADQQVAFAELWGELHCSRGGDLDKRGAVLVLDFKGERPRTDWWHSDSTMEDSPPTGSFLLARVVPTGGDTIFANQYLAYEALSDGMRSLLDGLKAVHNGVRYVQRAGGDSSDLPQAVHPVIRTHPETGRKALFVNSVYTSHFEGMTFDESQPLLEWLFAHSVQPNFTYRHVWTAGDLLMWDNRCLQHFAVADYGSAPRTMHRVTILGDRPS